MVIYAESVALSQSDAVCQPDGPPRLWDGHHRSAALHPAGGAAGSGELGRQEVSTNGLTADGEI